uniref:Uncharacterized protein n=1 Tax=Arundo donax TaxID=35708 RepID=A0A0A9EU21_ARUDO
MFHIYIFVLLCSLGTLEREYMDVSILGMHNFSNQNLGPDGRALQLHCCRARWLSALKPAAPCLQIPSPNCEEQMSVRPCIASRPWAFGLPLVLQLRRRFCRRAGGGARGSWRGTPWRGARRRARAT